MKFNREEIPEYYEKYNDLVENEDLNISFDESIKNFLAVFEEVNTSKFLFKYAADKWTIKELIQHCIDTERVFAYRALAITRGEKELLSFDENEYAKNSNANFLKSDNLLEDLIYTRANTKSLFNSFSDEQLNMKAIVSGNSMSVLAIGFVINGHLTHHKNILEERYLV